MIPQRFLASKIFEQWRLMTKINTTTPGLERDLHSKAIIAADVKELDAHRKQKKLSRAVLDLTDRVLNLEKQIENIQSNMKLIQQSCYTSKETT